MNVKLHTPKTLRAGSGMSSTKQFLLSLIATTISIVLTFGTAAIIDYHKKEASKKEMVMMVISDIDKTIELVQKADSGLVEARRLQLELANHPEHFDSLRINPTLALSTFINDDFSETTEKIFTSSIETFNTIGNVNFVNEVSSFYMARQKYKELLLDKLRNDIQEHPIGLSLKTMMSVDFPDYVFENWAFLSDMKKHRDNCMQMMHVSEKDMIKFNKRQLREKENADDEAALSRLQEYDSCNAVLQQAREKFKD